MLWAAVSYAAGIVAGTYFSHPVLWWLLAGLALLAAALYLVRSRKWLAATLLSQRSSPAPLVLN